MKKIYALAIAAMVAASANALDRTDILFPIGSATSWGWSTDDASALSETSAGIYTGTLYLKANEELKFMTQPDWGNMEYRAAEASATPNAEGIVNLAYSNQDPDNKMMVTESANYLITVDTQALTAKFVKSEYQSTEVNVCSLFMIGSATAGGWGVDNGTMMVQNAESPLTFTSKKVALSEGTFKITSAIKGGGSFDSKYFYFADPADPSKIIYNSTSDDQWSITEAGEYDVTANLGNLTISIQKSDASGVEGVAVDSMAPVYYNLSGVRVANPAAGQLLIRVDANGASKIRM